MRFTRRAFLASGSMAAASAAVLSATPRSHAAESSADRAHAPIAGTPDWLSASGTPGLAVGLLEHGKLRDVHVFGRRGPEGDAKVEPTTIFQAASLSKQVLLLTALAAVDAKKLDLDRPLKLYMAKPLNEPEADLDRITARHVLTHTSGWPNWPGEGPLKPVRPLGQWGYSGAGFLYLQEALESVWGEPATAYVERLVLGPLGMRSSSFVWKPAYESTAAQGVEADGTIAERWKPAKMNGASSLHTTAGEFARVLEAFFDPALRKRHPEVFMQQVPVAAGLGWSLGWGTAGDVLWQWGHSYGFKSFAALAPARGRGIVALSNGARGQRVSRTWVNAWLETDLAAFYFRDVEL